MGVREIPSSEWENFLTDFSRGHRAWLATVEQVCGGDASHVDAGRSLDTVRSELEGRRVVGIAIEFQKDSRPSAPVHIDAPVRLRVDETDEGRARALEIEDARGQCTRIRFRSAPPLDVLDGLAPGEI